jgi:MFS family permease
VGSPFLIAFLCSWANDEALDPAVLPWVIVPVAAVGALACTLSLRPDPRDLAVAAASSSPVGPARSPSQLLAVPLLRMAVIVAAVGLMAMVAVMGMTPVALHHHGTSPAVVSTVISLHIAGMWALSPFIGAALDRFGRRPGIVAAGGVSVAGCLVAATDAGAVPIAVGLFLIELGWSGSFLGANAVISDLIEPNERAASLGFNDLVVSLSSAIAGLTSAFIFEGAGFRVLGLGVAVVVLAVMVSVLRVRQPAAPLAVRR